MLMAELKKIWRPGTVLFILILSVLLYFSFMHRWVKMFGYGDEESFSVKMDILSDWIDKYGYSIDRTDFVEIEAVYRSHLAQADSAIAGNDYFRDNGVNDYEDFLDYKQNYVTQEDYDANTYREIANTYRKMVRLIKENSGYSTIYFQEYKNLIQQYRDFSERGDSILPYEVMVFTNNYLVYLAVWCLICVFFVSAPVMVNDRENYIVPAQYSSKKGKKVYRVQYASMVISSVFVVSVCSFIGMVAWKATGSFTYAGCNLASFLNREIPVISITYKSYVLLFLLLIYLIAVGMGSIIFILSAQSANIIVMLLKAIPVLALGLITVLLLQDAFSESNVMYQLINIKCCEVIIGTIIFVVGLTLNLYKYRVMQEKDC